VSYFGADMFDASGHVQPKTWYVMGALVTGTLLFLGISRLCRRSPRLAAGATGALALRDRDREELRAVALLTAVGHHEERIGRRVELVPDLHLVFVAPFTMLAKNSASSVP